MNWSEKAYTGRVGREEVIDSGEDHLSMGTKEEDSKDSIISGIRGTFGERREEFEVCGQHKHEEHQRAYQVGPHVQCFFNNSK